MARLSHEDEEAQSLLPASASSISEKHTSTSAHSRRSFTLLHIGGAFALGFVLPLAAQQLPLFHRTPISPNEIGAHMGSSGSRPVAYAHPWAGSTVREPFPPASPTNAFPELFPTNVGHAGPTPTGAEPGLVATASVLPVYTQAAHLVAPLFVSKEDQDAIRDDSEEGRSKGKHHKGKGKGKDDGKDKDNGKHDDWDLFKKWGNLSPWYTVPRGAYGIDSAGELPEGCEVTGLHLLHRHGARYPTGWSSYGGPAVFASRLHDAAKQWKGKNDLSFLNGWTYKLGEEVLTPFGRQQLFDLGVSMRIKYGFLLNNFTRSNTLPVFRTESQDRMLASAQNFAAGFFGLPNYAEQYQQLVTIEDDGFNNTLAPYKTCPNAGDRAKADRGAWYVDKWANTYLADARKRLSEQLDGFDLKIEDVYAMQMMCAYETVALGFSKFCALFTRDEWEGFDHALDMYFWYGSGFGSPVARVQGIGYVQELVARLTHTPIATHNSSTNATLTDDERTFPLDHVLYVDATHEVVVLNVLTALNLTTLTEAGPLKHTGPPKNPSFKVSQLAPFSTNVQFQLLSCTARPTPAHIRVIVNDGVVPLSNVGACGTDKDGLCALDKFVDGQKEMIKETSWDWGCHGDWEVPVGDQWETMNGYPPAPK